MVNMNNYEEYMLLYADKELSKEQEQELLAFVAAHPELQKELDAYAATQLTPDEAVIFADKSSLIKEEPKRKAVWFGGWKMYAAAAGVVLFIVLFNINKGGDEKITQNNIASNGTIANRATSDDKAIAEVNKTQQEDKLQSTKPVNAVAVETKVTTPQPGKVVNEPETTEIKREQLIDALPVSTGQLMAVRTPQQEMNTITVPEVTTGIEQQEQTPRIDIPGINGSKELIGGLAGTLNEKLAAAKEIRNEIKNTNLVVRVGQKELFTVRL